MAKAELVGDVVDAQFIGAQGISGGDLPAPTFAEVAFAGRSNVGKSSLINALLQRKGLVRTSSTPGCTRQVNLFEVKVRDGTTLVFADLPGYGFAKRSKDERKEWATLIERYLRERPTLRAIVVLFDARRGLEDDDRDLVEFASSPRGPGLGDVAVILAATKIDKLPKSEARSILARIGASSKKPIVGCSAITGAGREDLWTAIRKGSGTLAPHVDR
jgi:GTP-binding protein